MPISKQTPDNGTFAYNPLAGASITFFPRDRASGRTFLLEPEAVLNTWFYFDNEPGLEWDGQRRAFACNGRVIVTVHPNRQLTVTVNGKRTERYSIVYADQAAGGGKVKRGRAKRQFANY